MRIGIFSDTYPPYINGVSTSILMLKQALEKKGHQVFVVTVNNENLKYKFEDNGKIIRIPGVPTGIYDYRLTGIYPLKVLNKIKKWNLDVIHSQTEFGVGTFARIVSKQFGIPLVHTYHTMYEDYVHYITKGYFDGVSKKVVEYLTLFYCDRTITELIVPTKKAYELFKEKYKVDRNVYIVPTGIEVERFYLENNKQLKRDEFRKKIGFNKDDFVILFVGRVASEKNIELLLLSMPKLIIKNKHIKLLIVGDGPDMDKYKKYVDKNKLHEHVVFTGKVPWDNVPSYYLSADVFATASVTETQGLTVIEAHAASLPVVCINDESFTDTVINNLNGKVFKNKKEYINDIIELASNKDEYKTLSKQARLSANTHSSKYFADSVLDVYQEAIKNYPTSKIPLVGKIKNILGGKHE